MVSLVRVGSKTWVSEPVIESDRFGAVTADGYGTCRSPLRHHSPITKGWVSRW